MNLGQLRTALQQRGYGTDTAAAQTELIASVYRELWSSRPWSWLEASQTIATVAGTTAYTPSPAAQVVTNVWISGNKPLEPVSREVYRRLLAQIAANAAAANAPSLWTWFNKQVNVWPSPGAVFTLQVDYLKQPADLAADGDTPSDLPAQYHDILVWGAIAELAFRERNADGMNFGQAMYQRRLQSLFMLEDTVLKVRERRMPEPELDPPVWSPLAAELAGGSQKA